MTRDLLGESQRRPVALEGFGLSKRYGASQALEDVSIRLEQGQVTALAGGNGAGKSTLVRLLTGVEQPDEGRIVRSGSELRMNHHGDATRAGIFAVYQDQRFVPRLDVSRQMYLGYEQFFRRRGVISDRRMRQSCAALLEELGLTSIAPSTPMEALSVAARELVALATVLAVSALLEIEHPVVVLDEPTSALSVEEIDFLREFIRSLKARSALLFVSHRVSEVLDWADSVYVLRDGREAGLISGDSSSRDRLYEAMGGAPARRPGTAADAESTATTPLADAQGPAKEALSVGRVQLGAHAEAFDFAVAAGEIVGLAGLEGSGKEELLRLCAGLSQGPHVSQESVAVDGKPHSGRLRDLLDDRVVYLSGERQRDGVFGRLSVAENMAMSRRVVADHTTRLIRGGQEASRAREFVSSLAVRTSGIRAPMASLSGGNQQKVLIARCLQLNPRVMLLDNLTRGVDVGAKASIYELLRSLAADGVAIVMASDDLEELTTLADRILIFRDGRVAEELDNRGTKLSQADVLAVMV
jgi:ABC-type sugar transport system ATPase subunit